MAWRLAKSLEVLRKQVNEQFPKRSKASDGTIGDTAHSARASDHNPDADGIVRGMDLTNDPANGVDSEKLANALLASRDPRIKYVISNRKIASGAAGPKPWVWRKYSGKNPHNHHVHISVVAGKAGDSAGKWTFNMGAAPVAKPTKPVAAAPAPVDPIKPKPAPQPAPASDKDIIASVQRRLKELGYNPGGDDGILGPLTKGSILSFRNDNGLESSDAIDDALLKAIATASPRKMVPDRANASATEIAAKVPEANAHWWNKYLAGGGAGTGVLLAVGDAIAPAKGYVDQLRDDVPAWAWFLLFAIFCGGIAYMALRGQKSSDEAYRTGERR